MKKRVMMLLAAVVLLIVMVAPAFAVDKAQNGQDDELQSLYAQMQELQQKIAEKTGEQYDPEKYGPEFFNQMYDYCNGMMGGYGAPQNSSYGMGGYGMMGL